MIAKYQEYIKIYQEYKKFEENEKLVWARYYLEDYNFSKRVDFILKLIKNIVQNEFVVEIKFWEKNETMNEFMKLTKNNYFTIEEYKNGENPGIITISDSGLDIPFFTTLLQRHYNSDFSLDPSLSVKILLFVKNEDNLTVFDFYDDRGFLVNHYFTD